MTSEQYVILAYVVALGLLWGAVARVWSRRGSVRAERG
jgi:hypothetical protein